jgi:hypothetical protein
MNNGQSRYPLCPVLGDEAAVAVVGRRLGTQQDWSTIPIQDLTSDLLSGLLCQ